jgi:hypothetical protein
MASPRRNVSNVNGLREVRDGVYLEWLPGSVPDGLPSAIAYVGEKSISFHANASDEQIIRFPLRNTLATIRGGLIGIGEWADFVSEGRRQLSDYLQSEFVASHRIEHIVSSSPEGAMWRAVAESWWDDFDSPLPVVGPRLMAGARLVGPNCWFVAIGRRVSSRNSHTSHPSLQFNLRAASLDDVRREIMNMESGIVRDLHHLVKVLEVESD